MIQKIRNGAALAWVVTCALWVLVNDGVSGLFGATILGRGIEPNAAARSLLRLYNAKGVFNNLDDDLAGLSEGLKARFGQVEIETIGCVALFRAR